MGAVCHRPVLRPVVPDGFGGTEPRITCNAYLTTQRKAWDVLSDFCSAMRCMPVWNGQTLSSCRTDLDKVWTYNRSNVVMPDDGRRSATASAP
ncbi:phage tail protein [Escherichia coli]|uniref:phage tail protein n=1 Tax=Escherichia coli TaxID=562 RepID=UPI0003A3A53A